MDNLTIRHKDLIKMLLNEEDYKSMSYYSSILNVSPRTLYSDINAINCFIKDFHMEIDRKPGQGIKLSGNLSEKMELLHSLNSMNEKTQEFS
ncbi:helix-turn-helix domain-containing protein, partial [Clostridium polynesiense]|uniref:helix-turn-helix domain-containing protein n=1 Tax=Clostridium polynesiense TaxID=1325933 RepID=UPI000590D0D3